MGRRKKDPILDFLIDGSFELAGAMIKAGGQAITSEIRQAKRSQNQSVKQPTNMDLIPPDIDNYCRKLKKISAKCENCMSDIFLKYPSTKMECPYCGFKRKFSFIYKNEHITVENGEILANPNPLHIQIRTKKELLSIEREREQFFRKELMELKAQEKLEIQNEQIFLKKGKDAYQKRLTQREALIEKTLKSIFK